MGIELTTVAIRDLHVFLRVYRAVLLVLALLIPLCRFVVGNSYNQKYKEKVSKLSSESSIIRTWDSLAPSYTKLLENYPLFKLMARRLLSLTPFASHQAIADVGAGTGLLSQEVLKIFPDIELHVLEPASQMVALVQKNVTGKNVHFYCLPAEAIASIPVQLDRVFSNATFHLVELEQVFKNLSEVLKPQGKVVFNLWWHSFEETSEEDCAARFRALVKELLIPYGLTSPEPNSIHPPYTRSQIVQWATQADLDLEQVIVDRDPIPLLFFLDFMRMYSDRPHPDLTPSQREEFFEQAQRLLIGQDATIVSVRFLIGKRC